jgi:short-subunit dehydrogenase
MAEKINTDRHIVITGASSGIGEALAYEYAAPGVRLGLTGRNEERLRKVVGVCEGKGAVVDAVVLDVTNRDAMRRWLEEVDAVQPVDLVIANAGISAGTEGVFSGERAEQVRKVFDVNLNGVLNTIEPVLPRMVERGRGQIALMASLAGFRGFPGAPSYCASKAAVKAYGEGLRGDMADKGVKINVVCPGFVVSRMTDANDFKMPFLMKTDQAAGIIRRGLAKNRGRISFPSPMVFLIWVAVLLPDALLQRLVQGFPAKKSLHLNQ